MSRQLMRVPLDFAFTGPGAWPGYLRECGDDDCEGCDDCQSEEPPAGEGYQVWETVSEGSPISPVYATDDLVVGWLVEHENCAPEAARAFIAQGYAPSFIGSQFGLFKGVQVAAGVETHLAHIAPAGSHPPGTRVRHAEFDVNGTVVTRLPDPNADYYIIDWDRGLPSIMVDEPDIDPDAVMRAGCRHDGFMIVDGLT